MKSDGLRRGPEQSTEGTHQLAVRGKVPHPVHVLKGAVGERLRERVHGNVADGGLGDAAAFVHQYLVKVCTP